MFSSENLRLTKKQVGKSKKHEKEPSNIVQEKKKKAQDEPKRDTAEDRAKKELEKIAAYQARLAKKNNRQKKIRTVMDENNSDFVKKSKFCIKNFIFISNESFIQFKIMLF